MKSPRDPQPGKAAPATSPAIDIKSQLGLVSKAHYATQPNAGVAIPWTVPARKSNLAAMKGREPK